MSSVFQNLSQIENWDYNIFELNELVERQTLSFIGLEIFSKQNYFDDKIINEDKFRSFIKEVTKGYDRNVTYHNDLHAADVLQTTYLILKKGDVINVNIDDNTLETSFKRTRPFRYISLSNDSRLQTSWT